MSGSAATRYKVSKSVSSRGSRRTRRFWIRGCSSKGIARSDADGIAGKQLIAYQIAVHGKLPENVRVQALCKLYRDPGSQVRHLAGRIGDICQRPLIAALVQQVQLQLRHQARLAHITDAERGRGGVAGPEVV